MTGRGYEPADLHHVCLLVPNIDDAVKWFSDIVGIRFRGAQRVSTPGRIDPASSVTTSRTKAFRSWSFSSTGRPTTSRGRRRARDRPSRTAWNRYPSRWPIRSGRRCEDRGARGQGHRHRGPDDRPGRHDARLLDRAPAGVWADGGVHVRAPDVRPSRAGSRPARCHSPQRPRQARTSRTHDQKTLALVGAGPQIGRSIARRFGRGGFRVGLVARGLENLDSCVAALAADGIESAGFVADVMEQTPMGLPSRRSARSRSGSGRSTYSSGAPPRILHTLRSAQRRPSRTSTTR